MNWTDSCSLELRELLTPLDEHEHIVLTVRTDDGGMEQIAWPKPVKREVLAAGLAKLAIKLSPSLLAVVKPEP